MVMPQRKQITWTELRVGLFVLVGMFMIAVGIFYVTGAGILSAKYRLRTFLPEVAGLTIGAPVRLDGVEIGNVDTIAIKKWEAGEKVDPQRSIELVMRVNRDYKNYIRTDSTAGLITEGLLGNRYVDIHRGFTGTVLENNQEVPGREEKAIKEIVERGADLMQNLNVLSVEARDLFEGLHKGRGSLGKMLTDDQAYNHLNTSLAKIEGMVDSIQQGKGSLGKLVATDEVYNKFNSATGRLDNLLAEVQSGKGTLGKLVYDPSLHDNAKATFEKVNLALGDVRAGKGTLGKLATDDTLYTKFREIGTNLASATARLNENQTTAGKFFSDPQFYDNLTGLAGDLRLLVGEFRQNPKKFLRVKFSIF
jgi:phospholipid/cholesterol/gamma-HCH transport system substrate-binding protein